jgi:serine/threonine protein kinase
MSKGSLDTLLYNSAQSAALTATQKVKIITGIVLGMRYLHACGVMHRDLKPGNVLLTKGLSCKIADLGSARLEDPNSSALTSNLGTSSYMAPEIAKGEYGKPVDVFAFGVMLWEIVKCEQVYKNWARKDPIFIHNQIVNGIRPDVTGLPENAKQLMEAGWVAGPDQRPTFDAIFDGLRAGNYQLLPDVDAAEIREYVDPILAEEAEHPAKVIDDPEAQ